MKDEQLRESFGRELRRVLIAREMTTGVGNPAWAELGRKLERVGYESLRKTLTGERAASATLMEDVAAALGVPPTTFAEYRIKRAQSDFDPREVGFPRASANADTWLAGAMIGGSDGGA